MIYLDNSATTKPYPEVVRLVSAVMDDCYGNPSSLHSVGLEAERAVREASRRIRRCLGGQETQLVFTSGGTESDNLAILGAASALGRRGRRVVTSLVEHPAVTEAMNKLESMGFEVIRVHVDKAGRIDLDRLGEAVNPDTVLISVMHVNNETGTIQPIDEINRLKGQALFHTDAVQSFGKIPLSAGQADLLSLSAHKIHGPKGVGALAFRKGIRLLPQLLGGGQEQGLRSGTENVPGIAGFGLAAEMAAATLETRAKAAAELRQRLLAGIRGNIPDIRVNSPEDGSPFILNVSFLGTRGEVLLHRLEQEGVCVSTGAACSSRKRGKSPVLVAMGLSEREIEGAIRFSLGAFNTAEDIDTALDRLQTAVAQFRKLGSFR
jgi:cysteine desulfurase